MLLATHGPVGHKIGALTELDLRFECAWQLSSDSRLRQRTCVCVGVVAVCGFCLVATFGASLKKARTTSDLDLP